MDKNTADVLFRIVVIGWPTLTSGLALLMRLRAVDGLVAGEQVEFWFFGLPLNQLLSKTAVWTIIVCFCTLVTVVFVAFTGLLIVQLLLNACSAEKGKLGWIPWLKPYRCSFKESVPVFFWTALLWSVSGMCLAAAGHNPMAVLIALYFGWGGLFFLSLLSLSHFAR